VRPGRSIQRLDGPPRDEESGGGSSMAPGRLASRGWIFNRLRRPGFSLGGSFTEMRYLDSQISMFVGPRDH
jgi:hypothetical protein